VSFLAPALRAALLALVALALLFPRLWSPAAAPARVARFGGAAATPASLRPYAAEPPALFVRSSPRPPSGDELAALRAAGSLAPLVVALPEGRTVLRAEAPAMPRAGRAAAVEARVGGRPGETVTLRLADDAGPLDSARVTLDAAGRGAVAFRIRPPRSGWREWTVAAGGDTARTGAWVDSAPPPRVQVRAGLPSWESKFAVRALEESGASVDLALALGRGLGVAGGAPSPAPLDGPARPDVVIALDGAGTGDAERAALAAFADGGGGVLVAGDQASAALGVAGPGAADGPARGDRIRWSAPAELAPLPAAALRADARALGAPLPATTTVAAGGDGRPLLVLRPAGRGRIAGLGLRETWRWRMEAGRMAEHREFWRALVDWLDAAPSGPYGAAPAEAIVPIGEPAVVRVLGRADAAPPPLVVTRPGGARDTLPVSAAGEGDARVARFVPAAEGVHLLSLGDGPPSAAVRAVRGAASADGWTALALAAWESGGAAVPASALDGEISRRVPRGGDGPPADRRALLLAALLLLAAAEWTLRRVRGQR
jgi:hypothetical protein